MKLSDFDIILNNQRIDKFLVGKSALILFILLYLLCIAHGVFRFFKIDSKML